MAINYIWNRDNTISKTMPLEHFKLLVASLCLFLKSTISFPIFYMKA
jgi:hypothetical protein